MKEIGPVVVDDTCKKVRCECLVNEDKRKSHRQMAMDHNNLAKLVMDAKGAMKKNEDNQPCHNLLLQMVDGCIAKMNDLGEKLGCFKKSQIHIDINCCFF